MKATSKDVTLQKKRAADFDKVFRDLERWVGEAKIASWGAMNLSVVDDDEDEWKEGWALDRLCEALLGRGGLVPVSKKCVFILLAFCDSPDDSFLGTGNALNHLPKSHNLQTPQRGRTF